MKARKQAAWPQREAEGVIPAHSGKLCAQTSSQGQPRNQREHFDAAKHLTEWRGLRAGRSPICKCDVRNRSQAALRVQLSWEGLSANLRRSCSTAAVHWHHSSAAKEF